MSSSIVIPVLVAKKDATADYGGAATVGDRARQALVDHVKELAVDTASLDRVVEAATAVLVRVASCAANSPQVEVDSLSVHIGVTASGGIGLFGTGVEVEADASFEIAFKFVR